MYKTLLGAVVVVAVAALLAVEHTNEDSFETAGLIRVAVLPDEARPVLEQRYQPLLAHLASRTGAAFELVVPPSYSALLNAFAATEVELAYFGGLTFVQATAHHGASALVMRDVDLRFTSYFVVAAGSTLAACEDLSCPASRGKTLAFGSQLSTSGHAMPRFFLHAAQGMAAESWFGMIRYSGAHDATAYAVRDGLADIGAMNAEIFRAMLRDGRLQPGQLQVVWETPPYPDYVWATGPSVSRVVRDGLRDAFLELDPNDESHAEVLRRLDATAFLPANAAQFEPLKRAIAMLPASDE